MKNLQENHDKILEINRKILDLKTELVLLEGQKNELIKEHNEMIMDLQARLDAKEIVKKINNLCDGKGEAANA